MGNSKSKDDELTGWPEGFNESYINEQEPVEIEENDEIEWFVKNKYHKTFWKKLHKMQSNYTKYEKIKEKLKRGGRAKIHDGFVQKKYIQQNQKQIELMIKKNIYTKKKLMKIMNESKLITKYKIPQDITSIIVLFVGNGIIPITYTLSALYWFNPIHCDIYYSKSMESWHDEVRLGINHYAVFYPTKLDKAAHEFDQFIITRLAEGGDMLKYQHSMIPHIAVDKKYNIWDKEKNVVLTLPTKYSKCIGGIELFQRLYLEAAFNGKFDSFQVDLQDIEQTHGDNWCFDGNGLVLMANGEYKRIYELKVGDHVRSFPYLISMIECVIVSNINTEIEMVKLWNDCWITFEHPVLINYDKNLDKYSNLNRLDSEEIDKYGLKWILPKHISPIHMRYQDKIYNFVLDSHHTINVSGNWCCTLGHDYKGKVIEHEFWGNSNVIKSYLQSQSNSYPNVIFNV